MAMRYLGDVPARRRWLKATYYIITMWHLVTPHRTWQDLRWVISFRCSFLPKKIELKPKWREKRNISQKATNATICSYQDDAWGDKFYTLWQCLVNRQLFKSLEVIIKLSQQQTYTQMYHFITPELMRLQEELHTELFLFLCILLIASAGVVFKKCKISDHKNASKMMREKELNTAKYNM